MWFLNIIYYVLPFVLFLSILVFVHEFGHFIVARTLGIQVNAFSIGFGKELWGRVDKHGTRWKISAVPLGGYCQFLGDDEASSSSAEAAKKLTDEEKKHAFIFQNPFKKLAVVVAGPGFNYLLAVVIYFALFLSYGRFNIPPVIGEVMEGGAAQSAGLLKGDRILSVNNHQIVEFSDISREVLMAADHRTSLEVKRGDETLHFDIMLTELKHPGKQKDTKQFMLGIRSSGSVELLHEDLSVLEAFSTACKEVWDVTAMTLRAVGQMITGKRPSNDVGGIIRIAEMSGDITKNETFIDMLTFLALLSINLGLINLFPIPVLDGGHVVIFTLEIITGHELSDKMKNYLFKVGFTILLALMIYATFNDIVHLFDRFFKS